MTQGKEALVRMAIAALAMIGIVELIRLYFVLIGIH